MFSVHTNMLAANAGRQFGINNKGMAKSTEKLSSGYRINRAADDAAGLAISEKMRRQIRGLTQASQNAQDGISMVQTAEGAMNEIHAMLQRANELAVKAANGTLTDSDREMVDLEFQQLKTEIDNTTEHTVFNEIRLFPEDGQVPSMLGAEIWDFDLSYNMADGSFVVNSVASNVPGAAGADLGSIISGTGSAADAGGINLADSGFGVSAAGLYDASGVDGISPQAVKPTPSGGTLASVIATEMIPKAAAQIFDSFPSIKNEVGNETINIKITVKSLDGSGSMLARAGFSWNKNGTGKDRGMNLEIQFDAKDFTVADAQGTGKMADELRSTVAHELMHSIMQYSLTDHMATSGRKGSAYYFPDWFKEGAAQLAGGGFPTNWNNTLISYAKQLTDENDTSRDANIASYLKKYTVDNRPYGHGYLAAAYMGWLANGGGDVTSANIAQGMDKIFASLLNGSTWAQAVKNNTGMSEATIKGKVNSGSAELVAFVRELSYNSLGGYGSVIAPSLKDGGASFLTGVGSGSGGNNPNPPVVNPNPPVVVDPIDGSKEIFFQVGADSGQHIGLQLYRMDSEALGLGFTDVATAESAEIAIYEVKTAIGHVSHVRSSYGAVQNRLEHTISNLDNIVENTTSSEARIRDTDIATEMVSYANRQILLQAGQSVLSQANHQQDMIMSLLA